MTRAGFRVGLPCSSSIKTLKALLPLLLFAGLALAEGPAAQAQEYLIGARDLLKITVWGQDDLSKEYSVEPDGFVSFPLIGRVKAAGLTPTALSGELRTRLEKDYLVNPQVLVSVKQGIKDVMAFVKWFHRFDFI